MTYEQRIEEERAELAELATRRELARAVGAKLGAIRTEIETPSPWDRYERFTFADSPVELTIHFDYRSDKLSVSAHLKTIHNAKGERVDLRWRFEKIGAPQRTEANIAISKGFEKIAAEVLRRVLTPIQSGVAEWHAIKLETAQTDDRFQVNVMTISQAINGRDADKHELNGYNLSSGFRDGQFRTDVEVSKYGHCDVNKLTVHDLPVLKAVKLIAFLKTLQ